MLKSFEVKDYALIEHIFVEFGRGLNIITGETGAGKSILVDAMGLLLGERASTDVVRKGAIKSVVEGVFNVEGNSKIKSILDSNEIEFLPELIVRREISLKGSNRCFLNDTPVSLSVIKEAGNLLVDLHGQHEHQSLLRTETHIDFLDGFGDFSALKTEYKILFGKLKEKIRELDKLRASESSINEKRQIYQFQINEIESVSPSEGEEERLNEELKILENSEKLLELTTSVYELLYESESSVNDQFVDILKKINELARIDKSFSSIESEAVSVSVMLKDIAEFIRDYKSGIDLETGRLEEIRERLASLSLLKKKYGGSIENILAHYRKIKSESELAENFDEKINNTLKEINELRKNCGEIALRLSEKRKSAAQKIKKEVSQALSALGIPSSKFEIRITTSTADEQDDYLTAGGKRFRYSENGIDETEFFISTNPGEDPKPLAKIASGGEISRVMLALKSILAKNDKLPLLIFDEIDTGISGRIAGKVAEALKELASFHQIIAITHLPQIAGYADHHYSVRKMRSGDRVVSSIRKLTDNERVEEIAGLLSGEKITDASIKGAKELIK